MNEPKGDKERERSRERTLARVADTLHEGTRGVINMIIEEESVGGENLRKRKTHAQQVYSVNTSKH